MKNKTWQKYIELINKEVIPAIGCTEPIAVAYAAAKATATLNTTPQIIEVFVSGNMLKNGMGVGVPGTGMVGLDIAAAVGALGGTAEAVLEVLKSITPKHVDEGKKMIKEERVIIKVKENVPDLYIEIICRNGKDNARVVIEDTHINIVLIEFNGKVLFEKKSDKTKHNIDEVALEEDNAYLTVDSIYDFAVNVSLEDIKFIREKDKFNEEISKEGLINDYGLKVGKTIDKYINKGLLTEDIIISAIKRTSSGADARMAGCMMSAMSNSGSGNQGITVSMPVIAVGEKLGASEEKITRALALSNLMSIHIHSYLSRLAALCGVVVAGTAASCGITYLLGGDVNHIKRAINNMLGNITGLVCDGAKTSCALKVSTAVNAAVLSAILAIENIGVSEKEGIIDKNVENTIQNVGNIGSYGMKQTDKLMLDIMITKQNLLNTYKSVI
ncbi:L-cysteine desulfidase family protein [Clostridium sp. ZS2-4]|uniref:L-cysteine desulfidase family protein n=1 Tax=Clostridium sp. ZS2-4 TaxID=2987703 RepID=UPI00227AC493|nr:L-serine ammonia-lyase, iron-sulfur-dependent, subunit alpha [Clostridium sp. ZS2-4]MCY6355829.1 L-serine ammonia-lyase, iron-sulfur-dependent, subunit alpha [Clostridium sp. ZS2-4]